MPETTTPPSLFAAGTRQATRLLSMFMPLGAPVLKDTNIGDCVAGSQDQIRRALDANLALWRGTMTAGFNTVESVGRCLTDSHNEFLGATDMTSPVEFSRRQLGALHRRHRQLLGELRSITDQLEATWFHAMESVTFPQTGTDAESARVVEISEAARTADREPDSEDPEPASETIEVETPANPDTSSRRPGARGRQ